MKFVLLAAIVLLLVWLARRGATRVPPPPAAPAPAREAKPQDMVACAQCGVHLPRGEALPGRGGVFCGEAHRREHESAHGGS